MGTLQELEPHEVMPASKKPQTAAAVKKALQAVGSAAKAHNNAWFFKTGPGEYGEGDKFIGVTVPEQRKIAKQYKELALSQIEKLLDSAYHEHRLTGLFILNHHYARAEKEEDVARQKELYDFYIRKKDRVNNWDLVDSSAHKIVGPYLYTRSRKKLYTLVKSRSMWDRRIAVLSTLYFIRYDDFEDILTFSRMLLNDKEDLMHKATGWMLREMGKRDKKPLIAFLDEHAHEMPRTMLRYAIEKLGDRERKYYMNAASTVTSSTRAKTKKGKAKANK